MEKNYLILEHKENKKTIEFIDYVEKNYEIYFLTNNKNYKLIIMLVDYLELLQLCKIDKYIEQELKNIEIIEKEIEEILE